MAEKMTDPGSIARDLVEEITDTVLTRFNPRRGVLVPPKLSGRCPVSSMAVGETVMDKVDMLLDAASEEWPEVLTPEVYLDLVQQGKRWQVEWVVDTTGEAEADGDAEVADGDELAD